MSDKSSGDQVLEKAFRLKLKKKEGEAISSKEYDKIIRLVGKAKGRVGGDDLLSLDGEPFKDLAPLVRLKNLENISITRYGLQDISPLSKLKKLVYLDLRHNEIVDLSALSGLQGLIYLYLQDNRIKNLGPLAGLKNLRYLTLVQNPLSRNGAASLRKALPDCIIRV
tara:strand:+ start:237 stop:737 length:501 start_codon:yes stop_codon:yes gene_type:complete